MNGHATVQETGRGTQKWHWRVLAFCGIIFALELGLFLVVFPWLQSWDVNWLSGFWMSPYLRGALSGLGLLNIYIALSELFNQLKSLFADPNQKQQR
ncbi:MAG: hypothetical protein ACRD4O_11380 [Bryobacteraceae bacterium]